jgi:hypothetical protein
MPPKAKGVDAAVEQDAARKAETYETVQRAMLISQIEAACASRAKHIAKQSELEKKVTDITQGHGDVSAFLQKKLAKNYEQIGALEVSLQMHTALHYTLNASFILLRCLTKLAVTVFLRTTEAHHCRARLSRGGRAATC